MKKLINIATALLVTIAFVSCGTSSYMVVDERPTSPYYNRPARPGPGHVWIDGGWYYRGGHYKYKRGYWRVPPQNRYWSPGYWSPHPGGGYYYRPGRWRR